MTAAGRGSTELRGAVNWPESLVHSLGRRRGQVAWLGIYPEDGISVLTVRAQIRTAFLKGTLLAIFNTSLGFAND